MSSLDSGKPSTVLLLHAYPLSADMWREQKAALEGAGLTVLAPNLPGFGGTEGQMGTLAETARDLLSLLPQEPVSVVGLSMGGYLTLQLLTLAPERFGRVMLCDTTCRPDSPDKQQSRREQAARVLEEGRDFLRDAAKDEHAPATAKAVIAMTEQASREGIAAALEAMAAREESRTVLQDLNVPLLVVVGREDTITTTEMAQEMADAGKGEMVVIDGAGHLSNLDQPEAFNRELLRFLS